MKTWKWLLFTPVLIGGVVMFVLASLAPKRYQSEVTILVVPQQVSERYVTPAVATRAVDRLATIQVVILSRTRLEHIIQEQNLYPEQRRTAIMEDVVERMRQDITISAGPHSPDALKIAYVYTDPKVTMRVVEELASLLIAESLKDREVLTENTSQFLEGQIEDTRRRFIEFVDRRDQAAIRGVSPGERALLDIDIERMKDLYKSLQTKKEDSNLAANLERRQIGEQFRLLDPARIPEKPIGPTRIGMTIGGALIGFGAGLVLLLIAALRRSQP